jgi:cell division protein FtsZ
LLSEQDSAKTAFPDINFRSLGVNFMGQNSNNGGSSGSGFSKSSSDSLGSASAKIKVFGVGGAGLNAINNMIRSGLTGVEFYGANTDAQQLASSLAENKIRLGDEITKGLGAGADPEVGYAAARESIEQIRNSLSGADMVFITAGMGGGTGTLASSVVAEIAREVGALTVGVVTKPFMFEGKRRMKNAERGIEQLKSQVDTLITIPNQRLLSIAGRNTSLLDTFKRADDILFQAVKGISDLITCEGLVNVDFADVRAVMSEMGMAMMGTGESSGENRAIEAAEKAISSPLLEDLSINGARGILINVTASSDVTLQEVNEAAELVHAEADEDANIIWGMVIDPDMQDKVRVTVIATGFGESNHQEAGSSRAIQQAATSGLVASGTISASHHAGTSQYANTAARDTFVLGSAAKKAKENAPETVKLKKLSVLSGSEEDDKYEIPTFLRRQAE